MSYYMSDADRMEVRAAFAPVVTIEARRRPDRPELWQLYLGTRRLCTVGPELEVAETQDCIAVPRPTCAFENLEAAFRRWLTLRLPELTHPRFRLVDAG